MTRREGLERKNEICEFEVSRDDLFEDVLSLNCFFFNRTFFAFHIHYVLSTQSKHMYFRHCFLYPYHTVTILINITTKKPLEFQIKGIPSTTVHL